MCVTSFIVQHHKKKNNIAYPRVREAVATGVINMEHILIKYNPDGLLTSDQTTWHPESFTSHKVVHVLVPYHSLGGFQIVRVEINYAVSAIGKYTAVLRRGYSGVILRIIGYIRHHIKLWIICDRCFL